MATIQREIRKRSFMGKLVKWTFILFNIVMALWIFSAFGVTGDAMQNASSDAEKAGSVIGGTIATGMIMGLWFFGAVILGMLVMFTRGAKTIITEDQ